MGNVLDTILIKDLVTSPATVNSDYVTESVDVSFKEDEFSIQLTYDGGIDVEMTIVLEVSNDNVNFSQVTDSDQLITDSSGSHIIDVIGTGTNYARVKFLVTDGSINLTSCVYKAKRRH